MKAKLRWRMKAKETGLRAVCAGPRGYEYHDGTTQYASVQVRYNGWSRDILGWYWVAGDRTKVPHKNTCDTPVPGPEQAKREAAAYVQEHLTAHAK